MFNKQSWPNYFTLVLFFLVCLTVIWTLSDAIIDPVKVRDAIQEGVPFLFLSDRIIQILLDGAWQLLAALLLTITFRKKVVAAQQQILAYLRPPPPPFMRIADRKFAENKDIVFRRVPLLERDSEIETIHNFIKDNRPFIWCWMIGQGKQGKTRIALEACLGLKRGDCDGIWRRCHAGFFVSSSSDDLLWQSWQPTRPTLLIIDDAAFCAEEILSIVTNLALRAEELTQPVRILLVDRQVPESLEELEAHPSVRDCEFRIVIQDFDRVRAKRFAAGVWQHISPRILAGQKDAESVGRFFSFASDHYGLTTIEFMLPFLMGSLGRVSPVKIAQDRLRRWRNLGVSEEALNLVAMATLLDGLDWSDAESVVDKTTTEQVKDIECITYKHAANRIPSLGNGTAHLAVALLILFDQPLPKRRSLAEIAWRIAPKALRRALASSAVSFPADAFDYFISPPLESALESDYWVLLMCELFDMKIAANLVNDDIEEGLIKALTEANAKIAWRALLAASGYLALTISEVKSVRMFDFIEAAQAVKNRWSDNETVEIAYAELLKEAMRTPEVLTDLNYGEDIAKNLLQVSAIDIASNKQRASSETQKRLDPLYEGALLLRAESLAALIRFRQTRGQSEISRDYLEELVTIREVLPKSRQIAETHLAALESAMLSTPQGKDDSDLGALKQNHADLLLALSDDSHEWVRTESYWRWLIINLSCGY
ncbi:MAG: hypothetical protein AB4038_08410 [Prochloraceae cyanobacterium]